MRYLSVCSGIEAATQAAHPLGWTPVAFSEIEPFPCAVLKHHYPHVPNWGDMTKFEEWPDADVDVLCGGTPCQSFSVAGLRKGLADPRGNLMLTFGAIAARYRPRWLVWENVPGVLSSNGGRDFGTFLGMLGELGYGVAYRVLDAQHVRTRRFPFAVPQRRRRVFVVGYFGDWRRAAAVLFDRESLSGHPPPRREAGQGVARGFECGPQGGGFTDLAPTLDARCKDGPIRNQVGAGVITSPGSVAHCLNAGAMGRIDYESETFVAHALRGEGFDASEDDTGRGTPIVPIAFPAELSGTQVASSVDLSPALSVTHTTAVAFSAKDHGGDAMTECSPTLRAGGFDGSHANGGVMPAVATPMGFTTSGYGAEVGEVASTMQASFDRLSNQVYGCITPAWQVRRLTPVECERLQGFPDNFTRIHYRNKPAEACPDGPRYKSVGNSWPINSVDWLFERISEVDRW